MLTSLKGIGAYPFRQYADDPNVRVWFDMYNAAAQQYLDWLNGATGEGMLLGYYPGLSGAVLQWMAAGLYGEPYYNAIAALQAGEIGAFNTYAFNEEPFNYYAAPAETLYQITDDVFKRIITWNFYKGDGNRFSIRWLKRRIMRFIVGTNGIDPQPWNADFSGPNPDFVVGCENTQAISVEFDEQTCTVSINELALSALVSLAPNILQTFASAFVAPGVLEKPIEWNYVVNIETSLTAIGSPSSVSVVGASTTETTNGASVSVLGGSGSYTYAWTWAAGTGSGITINDPSADETTFEATGLTAGQTLTGIALCTVTDTVTHDTAQCAIQVSIERVTVPVATPNPTSISASGATDTIETGQVQVGVIGGQAPYSYAWTWQSGGTDIGINSNNTATTGFLGVNIAPDQELSGVALCTVTDAFGQIATCTVDVEILRASGLEAVISENSISVTGASATETTASVTVTPSGGVAPYSYVWGWQSGGAGIIFTGQGTDATAFESTDLSPGETESGVALCTVTDSVGQQAQVTCNVTIERVTQVSASVNPASQDSSGTTTTQMTGTSTVTASGGSGSYTYSWRFSSGGSGITINDPESAATSFTAADMAYDTTYSGVAQCTVTDGYGQTAIITVSVEIICTLIGTATIQWGSYEGSGETGDAYGWDPGVCGSLIASNLDKGTLASFATIVYQEVGTTTTILQISGLTANPGQDWFTTISTSLGTLSSAAATYSYGSGEATWEWDGSTYWGGGSGEYVITFST